MNIVTDRSMSIFKKWKWDVAGVVLVAVVGFFVWLGNGSNDATRSDNVALCGAKPTSSESSAIRNLNQDIREARTVLDARSDRVRLVDQNGKSVEYVFSYGRLWRNQECVVRRVRAFHFEYRDGRGNALTNTCSSRPTVETVGYTLRIGEGKKESMAYGRIPMGSVSRSGQALAMVGLH
jgi:hypothetical protein